MNSAEAPAEPHALATLLHLGRRARQAQDTAELRFVAVNETHGLAPYRQAVLWLADGGVAALSGVVSVEANTPYVQWANGLFRHLAATLPPATPRAVGADDLRPDDAAEWAHWLPPEALWLPLPGVGKRFAGGALLLARDTPWTEAEIALLAEWGAIWAQSCALHERLTVRRLWNRFSEGQPGEAPQEGARRRIVDVLRSLPTRPKVGATVAALLLATLPVKLTVLAPAELIPLNPSIIRAPLDGVIDALAVIPNQRVEVDQPLLEFDRTTIRNRLLVAERDLETARAEYRQSAQIALSDVESTAKFAVLQGRVAEKAIEQEFLRDLDARSTVLAPRAGVVLFDDPTEWIGRPVVTGERIMVVADEGEVEVEAWLSPADAIPMEPGAGVMLYLNADPLSPLEASLRYVAHEAVQRPDGTYAYRVRATLQGTDVRVRPGLKGTAKVAGDMVPFIYWVLRRPLADARAWLGL